MCREIKASLGLSVATILSLSAACWAFVVLVLVAVRALI